MPSPTQEEAQQIWDFIQTLPDKTEWGKNNDPFHRIWTRYKAEPEVLGSVLGEHSKEQTNKIRDYMAFRSGLPVQIPEEFHNYTLEQFIVCVIMATAVQSFAWGSEYQQRWVLPSLLDEALEVHQSIDKLLENPDG